MERRRRSGKVAHIETIAEYEADFVLDEEEQRKIVADKAEISALYGVAYYFTGMNRLFTITSSAYITSSRNKEGVELCFNKESVELYFQSVPPSNAFIRDNVQILRYGKFKDLIDRKVIIPISQDDFSKIKKILDTSYAACNAILNKYMQNEKPQE